MIPFRPTDRIESGEAVSTLASLPLASPSAPNSSAADTKLPLPLAADKTEVPLPARGRSCAENASNPIDAGAGDAERDLAGEVE